jgi:hypothetical protein
VARKPKSATFIFQIVTSSPFLAQDFDRQEERFNHEIERMTEKLQNAQYQVSQYL